MFKLTRVAELLQHGKIGAPAHSTLRITNKKLGEETLRYI